MAEVVDVLSTIFKTSGVQTLVNSMTAAENATDRLANAQARLLKAQATGNQPSIDIAQRRFNIAARGLMRETFQDAAVQAQPFLNVLKRIDDAASHAIDTFHKFGREVLDIQALTGASRNEASGAAGLLRAAGINDAGALKTLLGVGNAAFKGESAGALAMLGITPMAGQSSMQVLNQIIDRLSTLHDGLLKAHIETEIFGEGGAEALQPLLRMSHETREQIARFSEGLGAGAETAQKLDEASAKLSAGWQALTVRVGQPLAAALASIEDGMVAVLDVFDRFNKMTNGAGTWLIIFAGMAAGIVAGALAMTQLIEAFKALNAILKITITMQAALDALQGNAGYIAAAAAIAIGGYIVSQSGSRSSSEDFGHHVGTFGAAVNRFASNLDQFRSQIGPASLTDADIARLSSEMAQGAVG